SSVSNSNEATDGVGRGCSTHVRRMRAVERNGHLDRVVTGHDIDHVIDADAYTEHLIPAVGDADQHAPLSRSIAPLSGSGREEARVELMVVRAAPVEIGGKD